MEVTDESSVTDSNCLLKIFPKEIWIQILDKFHNTEVFERICVSSHFFKPLIRPRHQFAFVWPILAVYLERQVKQNNKHIQDDQDDEDDIDEPKLKELRWTMNLRLTCKLWKNAMDKFFQSLQGDLSLFSKLSYTTISCEKDFLPNLEQKKLPSKFLERFSNIKNPFPSRSVFIDFNGCAPDSYVQNSNVFSIFSKYGHHILFLDVEIYDYYGVGEKLYFTVKTLLEFTPNLKKLYLAAQISTPNLNELSKYIDCNPFPVMNNLESILLESNLPFPFIREIFQRNPQIESVVGFPHHYPPNVPENALELLKNIKKLEFFVYLSSGIEKLANCPEGLTLEELDLKYLLLYRFDGFNETKIPWSRALRFVEKLGQNTLKKVKLVLPSNYDWSVDYILDGLDNVQLNLLIISELRLCVKHLCSLEFLLGMKNTLRKLCISTRVWRMEEDNFKNKVLKLECKKIKFWQFLENPLNSNIWFWLNNLKCLVLDHTKYGGNERIYLRADYNFEIRNV